MVFNWKSIDDPHFVSWSGTSPNLIAKSLIYATSPLSSNYRYIITSGVFTFAKRFFSCEDFLGMPLKKDTLTTPVYLYWDRKYAFFDILAADHSVNPIITKFTGYLLQDSGWYVVDIDLLPETNWGFRRGCGLFTRLVTSTSCDITTVEYSGQINKQLCSVDYKSKGSLALPDAYMAMDNCPTFKKVSAYYQTNLDCTEMNRTLQMDTMGLLVQEYFGPDSRCFLSKYKNINMKLSSSNSDSLDLPTCQKFQCSRNGTQYSLRILFDNQWIQCPYEGGSVSLGIDLEGSVQCPQAYEFCRTVGNHFCPNQCSGRGHCNYGECICFPGYFGDDCSTTGETTNANDTCIWPLKSPTCKIKAINECYFFCSSTINKISWLLFASVLSHFIFIR